MITIDGAAGEGGGQILRNALALSLLTGQPFRLDNIRGRRPKPGLMRQHITAIEAAMAIGAAACDGLAIGATSLVFRPGRVRPGAYQVAIGTAGSTGLVLQTILLPLVLADGPSHVVIEGGTHNPQAPPYEFIARCFLPRLRQLGAKIDSRLVRHGFHPAGGGRIEVDITPSTLEPVEWIERGALRQVQARALIASLPVEIAAREITSARQALNWDEAAGIIDRLPEQSGPGNILLLEAQFDHITEIVSGFGQRGVAAEKIGAEAAKRMAGYLAATGCAGPYLADQLLLPLALAGGGGFTTVSPTLHARSAAEVIRRFLDREIGDAVRADGAHRITIR